MQLITYNNKSTLVPQPDVAEENKVTPSNMNEIKSVVNTNVADLGGAILWTNSNPTSSFDTQTINLSESLANYDMYEIIFRLSTAMVRAKTTGKIPVGQGTILDFIAVYPKYRYTGESVTGSTILFGNCNSLNAIGSSVVENTSIVPLYVLGYKTGLF